MFLDLNIELQQLKMECERLRQENELLKKYQSPGSQLLGNPALKNPQLTSSAIEQPLSLDAKIKTYRSLFKGREDVFAKRWETKNGKTGYSPVCANEWDKNFCKKPKIKCGECQNRKLLSITEKVIYNHLAGNTFIGFYPLLEDETCWLLAVDFDKDNWPQDAKEFAESCKQFCIPYAFERSQSGNGAHIWIFFNQKIPASLARKLGCALLTNAMQRRHQIKLSSYDRFFPNQDTLPKGGFGNLIALPLQGNRRKENKSIFLDHNFEPFADQWKFLNNLQKVSPHEVTQLVNDFSAHNKIIDIRKTQDDDSEISDPWVSSKNSQSGKLIFKEPLPASIKVTLANLVYIESSQLPSPIINQLKKIAAFQNSEFYKAQAMRLPTYDKPRIISCAEEFPRHIGLPRGCLNDALNLLRQHSIVPELFDETLQGSAIEAVFKGNLRPNQLDAISALKKSNIGILAASTGFGKTVLAAFMIAQRKVNTLILVHRQQLMDQWQEKLSLFLNKESKQIGIIGGGKNKPTGEIDIAMLQSLFRKGEVNELVKNYGHVIVDECHHISAFSFEQVLKQVKAKYVLGLTATPIRKDGHHPIIIMQCGQILYRDSIKNSTTISSFSHVVKFRITNFFFQVDNTNRAFNDIYAAMIADEKRNEFIFNDILEALKNKRSPLLLTERTQHLEYWENKLKNHVKNILVLKGGIGKKQRHNIYQKIASIPPHEERLIIATGRYVGEGFDDARLDTLFLTTPISWHGTLQQYIGRLHREYDNKHDVIVYDYVDKQIPMIERMFNKRLKKYQALGYEIE